jgi:uncharacterized protein (TIGR02677 family)
MGASFNAGERLGKGRSGRKAFMDIDKGPPQRSEQSATGGPYSTFVHLAVPKVELYRSILRAFSRAKEHFEISLRPSEVSRWLPSTSGTGSEEELVQALDQLRQWGNLDASQDTSEVQTVEEFNRQRLLYQFTAAGEATEQALSAFDQHCLQPGELQTTALRDILQTLEELHRLLSSEPFDVAKAIRALRELTERFHQLVTRAQSFMRSVQQSIDAPSSEMDLFLQHKEALLNYLERFIGELVLATHRVSTTLREIESSGVERALVGAAEAEIADALQPDAQQRAAACEHWHLRWQGLRRWFLGEPGTPSQAEILRARARGAIPALLETVRRLNDRRASRSDRATDFITLAKWFASAPTEGDLHRLWRAAFGLTPARHLRVNDETLAAWEEHETTARTSWTEAPPFYITPRLREIGQITPRGPVRAIIDRSAELAQLSALALEEEQQTLAARRALATGRPRCLSELPFLEERELEVLLDLLGEALTSEPDVSQNLEATSEDGTLLITLAAPIPSTQNAVVETRSGTLRGPDYTVTITEAASKPQMDAKVHVASSQP